MDGILSIIKPPGITSHDAISILRRLLKERRLGHTGTLDPMAGGVLPVYVGKATRLIEQSDIDIKTYVAEGCFGYQYDTEDCTGQVVEGEGPTYYEAPSWARLEEAITSFQGDIEQRPSAYSAIKVQGKRAYELAREGKDVILPTRTITIYHCELLAYAYPHFTVRVTCSGGTYIRSLLRDIGKALAIPCSMAALLRVAVGPYTVSNSVTFEEVEEGRFTLFPVWQGVAHLPKKMLTATEAWRISQGQTIREKEVETGLYQLWTDQYFLGLGEKQEKGLVAKKILYPLQEKRDDYERDFFL